jgi:hypothetical protein
MSIIGNKFDDYVDGQIKIRQQVLGEGFDGSRQLKNLKAFNSSTPWIRLASAVKITEGNKDLPGESVYEKLESLKLNFPWKGDDLSKGFVLFGPPTTTDTRTTPSGIIGDVSTSEGTTAFQLTKAYGYGYSQLQALEKRGYIPPPGIVDASFEYKNDGALAFATINIKAFSEIQFSIIDILFQRPGYTCLLEFGHTLYLDNEGELKEADFNTEPFNFIFKQPGPDVTYSKLADAIKKEKEKWKGNYEGFFGRISKFNWNFNADGSYDITVKLTGMGDVISSLKVNVPRINAEPITFTSDNINLPGKDTIKNAAKEGAIIISEAASTQLNSELYYLFKKTKNATGNVNFKNLKLELKDIPAKDKLYTFDANPGLLVTDVNDNGGTKYSPLVLIKFSLFLAIVQKICNLEDGNKGSVLFNFKMLNDIIDKKDETYIVTYPGNFSANPNKCLIYYTPKFEQKVGEFEIAPGKNNKEINLEQKFINNNARLRDILSITKTPELNVPNPKLAMRLSDVYVDLNFITKTLKDLRGTNEESEDEIEVNLIDFLKRILEGINTSLGGINDFKIKFNEVDNVIDIVSESPILSPKEVKKVDLTTLNTFGLLKNQGSFITSMGLNSELTDQMATQISIGAQSNSSNPGSNATSFSTYNKGLIDRLFVEKKPTVKSSNKNENKEDVKKEDKIQEIFSNEILEAFKKVYQERQYDEDYINTLENINSNVSKTIISRYTKAKAAPDLFFLPFNLELEMHGLGGIKIYQAFRVDGRGLPPSYDPNRIKLIIKSLSHTINSNGWKTKIQTLSTPIIDEIITTPITPSSNNSSENNFVNSFLPPIESTIPGLQDLLLTDQPTRNQAMQVSFNAVFGRDGEKSGLCARYSYNLALNYCRGLKPTNNIPGIAIAAGGNAKQNNEFWKNLVKLGYTQSKVGQNLSKSRIIEIINTTSWGSGDIIVYYANDGDTSASHVKYGHAQIYVGNLTPSKWSTSVKNNYGGSFIYNKRESNKWDLYIFRAPANKSQVKI